MVPQQQSMRLYGDLTTTDRQSTFCKEAIKPDQITLCWTRKRSVCALMAMLETYGVQFPVWLRCRRCNPCWFVCDARDPITIRSPHVGCNLINAGSSFVTNDAFIDVFVVGLDGAGIAIVEFQLRSAGHMGDQLAIRLRSMQSSSNPFALWTDHHRSLCKWVNRRRSWRSRRSVRHQSAIN